MLRHPGDNRTQIRELGQTLIDGGILDELISEKLEAFNSHYDQLNHQVRTLSMYVSKYGLCVGFYLLLWSKGILCRSLYFFSVDAYIFSFMESVVNLECKCASVSYFTHTFMTSTYINFLLIYIGKPYLYIFSIFTFCQCGVFCIIVQLNCVFLSICSSPSLIFCYFKYNACICYHI